MHSMDSSCPCKKPRKHSLCLRSMGLRLDGYELRKDQSMIMIPLAHKPSELQSDILRRELGTFQIQQVPFERKVSRPKNLQEAVAGQIPSHMISILPRSFDVIGDIAIIDLPSELGAYAMEIGNGILQVSPHVRLVARKSGRSDWEISNTRFADVGRVWRYGNDSSRVLM